MELVLLSNISSDGEPLTVTYLLKQGLNMASYKKGDIEAIDQSTRPLFDECFAGLGPMIGPHFYHRPKEMITKVPDESLFPFIARERATGSDEPFTHGIGRYIPWKVHFTDNSITGTIKGSDEYKGVLLKDLEGQDFTMTYEANLLPDGLHIAMSVASDKASIVGLHYYYALKGGGTVTSQVQDQYNDMSVWKTIPDVWWVKEKHHLKYDLNNAADFGFLPYPDSLQASILLKTSEHSIRVSYTAPTEENSWQLWHPKDASFVCIEPVSAKNSRRAVANSSSIHVKIEIL